MAQKKYKQVVIEDNTKILWKSCQCVSTDMFYSSNGYKLRLALKSTENRPTASCPATKPNVEIGIVALRPDDDNLEWPVSGEVKLRFKKSQQSNEFNGDPICVPFRAEQPTWCDSYSGPIRQRVIWTPVPKECIPGEETYVLPNPWEAQSPSMNTSSIPETLYVQIETITID